VLAAPGWITWFLRGHHGSLASPVTTSLILAANIPLTRTIPKIKGRVVRLFQKYVLNPPIRALLQLGVLPVGYALLQTTGCHSGKRRRTPVGNGLVGETFWIVAEHGHSASYVRNLQANPQVRIKIRHRLRPV
jgi:hypothetical protein